MTEVPEIALTEEADLPTVFGSFRIRGVRDLRTGEEHAIVSMGAVAGGEGVLTRLHSSCVTGDALGSLRCDCREQLHHALEAIAREGRGVLVYLQQEGRGIGLAGKMQAYALQDQGEDTVDANVKLGYAADARTYGAAVAALRALDVRSVRLLTNNPVKREALEAAGFPVLTRVPLAVKPNPHNERYLETKRARMGHHLPLHE